MSSDEERAAETGDCRDTEKEGTNMATSLTIVPTPRFPSPRALLPVPGSRGGCGCAAALAARAASASGARPNRPDR